MSSLPALTDVMGTGHHAAVAARVGPGKTVAAVGDGAVGLCGVIASKRLGAERILLGSNPERIAPGKEFGATAVVGERGDEAVEHVRELTAGQGAHSVLECLGLEQEVGLIVTSVAPERPSATVTDTGCADSFAADAAIPDEYLIGSGQTVVLPTSTDSGDGHSES